MLGAAGVDIFFVISGYVISTISYGEAAASFLAARFWRVYPPWLLAVLPWLLTTQPTLNQWFASLTLWPIYGDFTVPALDLGWTLSFELLFYISTAIALQTRSYVPLTAFAAAVICSTFIRSNVLDFLGNPIIFEFLMGVALTRLPRSPWSAPVVLLLSIALFWLSPTSIYNGHATRSADYAMCRVLLWGIPSALLVYGCVSLEKYFRGALFELLVVLGNASYSIYLWHPLFLRYAPRTQWTVEAFLAIAFGVLIYFVVEKPILCLTNLLRSKMAGKLSIARIGTPIISRA